MQAEAEAPATHLPLTASMISPMAKIRPMSFAEKEEL